MLKSAANRPAPCRLRQAAAILTSVRGSATSAFVSVLPGTNPSTSTRSAGQYSMTGAPTPAAAAISEFWYSLSRSIASCAPPSEKIRATNTPSGVVTLKFWLVSPPGSALTCRGVPARLGTLARAASGPTSAESARRCSVTFAGYEPSTKRSRRNLLGSGQLTAQRPTLLPTEVTQVTLGPATTAWRG